MIFVSEKKQETFVFKIKTKTEVFVFITKTKVKLLFLFQKQKLTTTFQFRLITRMRHLVFENESKNAKFSLHIKTCF